MPLVQGRKRRAETQQEDDDNSVEASPEPQTQRRRTDGSINNEDADFGGGEPTQDASVRDMSRKLVRLALACEFQRRAIRRQDISEKVLGANSRAFKNVWNMAQLQLQTVFGMEMVELPAREKITLQQRRAAQKKGESQSKNTSTPSWILVSTLPPEFHHPDIVQPPAAPTSSVDAQYTAIYSILVALISLSGGSVPEAKMERYLKRLKIYDTSPIPEYEKTDKLMKRLEKDGYLLRIKESTGTGEDDIYYVVGPRGRVEVSADGVRGLAKAVYGDLDEEGDDDLDRKLARSLGLDEPPVLERQEQPRQRQRGEGSKNSSKRKSRNVEDDDDDDEDDEDESEHDDDDGDE